MDITSLLKQLSSILIGVCIGYFIFKSEPETEIVIQPIRDSIYIINDSIQTQIIYIEKKYNEKIDSITNNSDSDNIRIFSEYINHYKGTINNH